MDSAFYLHGLTDVVPELVHVATPRNSTRIRDSGVRQHFMLPGLLGTGVQAMEGGYAVRAFSWERMLVELLRNAGTLPMDYYRELIGSYLGSRASSKCTRWRTVWCCTEAPTRSST